MKASTNAPAGHPVDPPRQGPRASLEQCLERVATREAEVRAFVRMDADAASAAARHSEERLAAGRPLSAVDGTVVGVKDVFETADFPTACGSAVLDGFEGRRDAATVAALRRAGAVILGKTVTTEFAVGAAGPTRNPRDVSRSPGGSSSGSAAAVAAGMVDVALGTQTQSSTLRPASYCGATGFKPSFGAASLGGVHPLAPTMDTFGVLAPDIAAAWRTFRVATGELFPMPLVAKAPARVAALRTAGWAYVSPPAADAFADALRRLADAGIEIADPAEVAEVEGSLAGADALSDDILAFEMEWPFRAYDEAHPGALGQRVKALVERSREIAPARYQACLMEREALRACFARLASRVDVVITLASPTVAPEGFEAEGPPPGARSLCVPATLIGAPAVSLPCLTVAGLPLGLQLIGAPGGDRSLAAHAHWIEDLFGASPFASSTRI